MPYHIKRRKLFQQDKFVYYCETDRWTEEYENCLLYTSDAADE